MCTMHYTVVIDAPKEKVWQTMLDADGYRSWASEFRDGSYYQGSWEEGEEIRFMTPNGNGFVAKINENRPYEFLSVMNRGMIYQGKEDVDSLKVKAWAPTYENVTLKNQDGKTELKLAVDLPPDFEDRLKVAWPQALDKLKILCEAG